MQGDLEGEVLRGTVICLPNLPALKCFLMVLKRTGPMEATFLTKSQQMLQQRGGAAANRVRLILEKPSYIYIEYR